MLRRVTICPAFTPERSGSLHDGTLLGRFIYTNATTTEKPGTSPTSPAKCFSVLERILVPRQRLNEETEPGKAPDCLLGGPGDPGGWRRLWLPPVPLVCSGSPGWTDLPRSATWSSFPGGAEWIFHDVRMLFKEQLISAPPKLSL